MGQSATIKIQKDGKQQLVSQAAFDEGSAEGGQFSGFSVVPTEVEPTSTNTTITAPTPTSTGTPELGSKIHNPEILENLTQNHGLTGSDIYKDPNTGAINLTAASEAKFSPFLTEALPNKDLTNVPESGLEEVGDDDIDGGGGTIETIDPSTIKDPSIKGVIDMVNTFFENQEKANKIQTDNITALLEKASTKSTRLAEEEAKAGIAEKEARVADLDGQLKLLQAQALEEFDRLENQPIPRPFITGSQAQLQRTTAVKAGSLALQISALQGQIDSARHIAERAIALEFEPIEQQIEIQKFLLERNDKMFDAKERQMSTVLGIALDERARVLADEKEMRMLNYDLLTTLAQSGADTTGFDANKSYLANVNLYQDALAKTGITFETVNTGSQIIRYGYNADGSIASKNVLGSIDDTLSKKDELDIALGLVESGYYTDLDSAIGAVERGFGGSVAPRANRNNNPLNIKVPAGGIEEARIRYNDPDATVDPNPPIRQDGTEEEGRFIHFSDMQKGWDAVGTLMMLPTGNGTTLYGDLSIEDGLRQWSNHAYGAEVTSLDPNKLIRDLDAAEMKQLQMDMGHAEGFEMFTDQDDPSPDQPNMRTEIVENHALSVVSGLKDIMDVPVGMQNEVEKRVLEINSQPDPDDPKVRELNTIMDLISGISDNPALDEIVGANILARAGTPYHAFITGERANVMASIKKLTSDLTLAKLVSSKEAGATFGALSEKELKVIAEAATTLGSFEIEIFGWGTGQYNVSEEIFQKELLRLQTLMLQAAVKIDPSYVFGDDELGELDALFDGIEDYSSYYTTPTGQ